MRWQVEDSLWYILLYCCLLVTVQKECASHIYRYNCKALYRYNRSMCRRLSLQAQWQWGVVPGRLQAESYCMVPGRMLLLQAVVVGCSPRQGPGRELWFQVQWQWGVVPGQGPSRELLYGSRQNAVAPDTVVMGCSPRQAPGRQLWFQAVGCGSWHWWWAVVPGRLQADSYGSRQ